MSCFAPPLGCWRLFWADRIAPTREELNIKKKGVLVDFLVALNINKVARSQAVVVCFEIAARYIGGSGGIRTGY